MFRTSLPFLPPRRASLALGILFAFGAASLGGMPGTAAAQVTLNVPAEYPTIQQAIDAAGAGDTVLVAPGTYLETIDMGPGGFTLRSSHGAEVTIIDAQQADQSPVVRVSGAPAGTVLEGFTITGGTGAFWKPGGHLRGGGVSVVQGSLDMIDCRITGNTADWGGGVDVRGAAVTVTGTEFIANEATIGGGGVVVGFSGSSLTLENCLFEDNSASSGGGLNVNSGPAQVNDCVFIGNHADSAGGGAIVFNSGEFTNCHFENNTATLSGGGVRISGDASFDDCQFIGNQASRGGGGAIAFNDSAVFHNCRFENNIATGEATSSGGGLHVANDAVAVITACEFVDNVASGQLFSHGGGLNVIQQGDATVTLTLFQNNEATFGGGAGIQSNASAMFSECSFVGNTADQTGGGANVVKGHPEIVWVAL